MQPLIKPYIEDEICALATPAGVGALSLIRVSGKQSELVFKKFFKHTKEVKPRHAYFKKIFDSNDNLLDEVVVTFFENKKSFTGEPSFEITCHGSPLIVKSLLLALIGLKVRVAEPGEFSYRAYLNGKIDLVKAEGIHSTIHAESEIAKELSLNLLGEGFRNKILELKDAMVFAISRLEASIDFSDQDIDLDHDDLIFSKIDFLRKELSEMLSSYKVGSVQRKGVKVALFGPPNSGKSSLFNLFANHERSIVSDVAGTTRDYISQIINLKGKEFELIDTAGVRSTSDSIEKKGVEKSLDLIKQAQLVLFLVSKDTVKECDEYGSILSTLNPKKVLLIETKQDLGNFKSNFSEFNKSKFSINSDDDFKTLKSKVLDKLSVYFNSTENVFIERHVELLSSVYDEVESVDSVKKITGFEDVLTSKLYLALESLDQILYIDDPEAVRDKIFKDFCLGK